MRVFEEAKYKYVFKLDVIFTSLWGGDAVSFTGQVFRKTGRKEGRMGRFLSLRARVLGFLLLMGLACHPAAPAASAPAKLPGAPKELKVGIVAFLSGPASAPFGIPARNAAEVWIEKINREGGIGGAKIVPVFTDEAGPADKVVAEFRRLVLDEKVDFVVGYISSANCLAVPPVAEELKTLTILADCGTVRVFEEAKFNYVFRTHAHTIIDGIGAARSVLAIKPDLKTVAGINQDYAWGRDSWEIFIKSLLKLKPDVKVVDALWPKLFAGEFSAELSTLLAAKPDVIFSSFWGSDLITFARHGKARGLFEQSLVVVNNTGADIKDLPEGLVIGSRGPHGIVSPALEKHPLRREFLELYRRKFGLARNSYISHGAYHYVQAVQGVKAAYEKAMNVVGHWPTVEEVSKAFAFLEFDTPSGHISMAIGGGHQAIEPAAYGVIKFDSNLGSNTFTRIRMFQIRCVSPPNGVKSVDWINEGFPGAQCP